MNLFQALKEIKRIAKFLHAEQITRSTSRYLKIKGEAYWEIKDDAMALSVIVEEYPALADRVFKIFSLALQQDKVTKWNAMEDNYYCLASIVRSKPSLADDVFDDFKTLLQSNKNYGSMREAFIALRCIIDKQPKLAGKVLECVKIGLKSNKNYL